MAPRAFSKLFSSRSSTRSNGSDRRSSLESIDSGDSYVISLVSPACREVIVALLLTSPRPAEMLDDDNLAWGRPSRKQHSKTQYWGRS
ncbi:hypothetical protein OH76DRAFT_1337856 [Lentinus brumalis]|uniref:Uncharacterized protein n=1 Tax=Lentinus brumalis TaxID=2498619 RepID=A0A371DUV9_9APHY|nr:hypothetical protein OH76DRAFT_1337856 [Polyporus brumalis]